MSQCMFLILDLKKIMSFLLLLVDQPLLGMSGNWIHPSSLTPLRLICTFARMPTKHGRNRLEIQSARLYAVKYFPQFFQIVAKWKWLPCVVVRYRRDFAEPLLSHYLSYDASPTMRAPSSYPEGLLLVFRLICFHLQK